MFNHWVSWSNYRGSQDFRCSDKLTSDFIQIGPYTFKKAPVFCYLKFLRVCSQLLSNNKELDDVVSCKWHSMDFKTIRNYDYSVRRVIEVNSMCHQFSFYVDEEKFNAFAKQVKTRRIIRNKVDVVEKLNYEEKQFLFNFHDAVDRYSSLVASVDSSVFEDFNFK